MKQRRPKLKMLFSFIATFLCGVMLIQTPHMYVKGEEHTHDTKASDKICYNYSCHTWQKTYHSCPVCNGQTHLGNSSCTTCNGTGGVSDACPGILQYWYSESWGPYKCSTCGASYSGGCSYVKCDVCGRSGQSGGGSGAITGEGTGTTTENQYKPCHTGSYSSGEYRQGASCASYPKDCPTCGGTGRMPCTWCSQLGYVQDTCGICNGNYTNGVPCSLCENGVIVNINTNLCTAGSYSYSSVGQIDQYSWSNQDGGGGGWTRTGYWIVCNGCGAAVFGALESGSYGGPSGGGSISAFYLYPSKDAYSRYNYDKQGSPGTISALIESVKTYITHNTTTGIACKVCGGDSLIPCTSCVSGKQYQVTKGFPVCNKVAINIIQR